MNSFKNQTIDQTGKGAVAALVIYVLYKIGVDSDLVLLLTPVVVGLLAWASRKVGDPSIASFFDDSSDEDEQF